jgi:rare lipoprotein A
MNGKTAAHRELPFNTWIEVTNLENGKSCTVRINDRGPFMKNRILDLSKGAGVEIGLDKMGVAKVQIHIISLGDE